MPSINVNVLSACHDTTPSGVRTWCAEVDGTLTDGDVLLADMGPLVWPPAESELVAKTSREAIDGAINMLSVTAQSLCAGALVVNGR